MICSMPEVVSVRTNALGMVPAWVKVQSREQYTSVWYPTCTRKLISAQCCQIAERKVEPMVGLAPILSTKSAKDGLTPLTMATRGRSMPVAALTATEAVSCTPGHTSRSFQCTKCCEGMRA